MHPKPNTVKISIVINSYYIFSTHISPVLKIKLSRTGKRNQPHFRIIVGESEFKPTGRNVDILGHYIPTKKEFEINFKKYKKWVEKGAQPTRTVKNLVKKHQ